MKAEGRRRWRPDPETVAHAAAGMEVEGQPLGCKLRPRGPGLAACDRWLLLGPSKLGWRRGGAEGGWSRWA